MQQMAQAQQQMQQALGNMQGVKQALQQQQQQMQQAQQNLQNGQQCANGQCNGQGQGQKPGQQAGNNPFKAGDPANKQGMGRGGPGVAQGGNSDKELAPFGTKYEQSQSQEDEGGKILARYAVKDQALKGESKQSLQKVASDAMKEAADEVESEHANRQAQKVAQKYFSTMAQEGQKK
jgi:hypothetical protein